MRLGCTLLNEAIYCSTTKILLTYAASGTIGHR
jgi:hypothetical protein